MARDFKRPNWYDYVCTHDGNTIDRTLLTRKQHNDLLAMPRIYTIPPMPPRGKRSPCPIPKICPPRIDQLAVPTVKAMEGVLQFYNQTLEPVRIIRLVKLIHTKETERPLYSVKRKKKKKKSREMRKKDKKRECLKLWLKKRTRKSAKLIVDALRKRKPATPNYRQLLVAMGLMKAMKIKRKKHLSKYTKLYLNKICEQLAIICDTEWAPYKKLPVVPEAVPLEPAESVISRKHVFWKMRPIEIEEEVELTEAELVEEEEQEGEAGEVIAVPTEEVPIKEEAAIKEEMPSIAEIESGEEEEGESTLEGEYKDYERELEMEGILDTTEGELEVDESDKPAEPVADLTTDDETGKVQSAEEETAPADEGEAGKETDATEAEATEGETPEGDATEGDATEGDATEGDVTEGDATQGDATEGDATEGEAVEGETAEGEGEKLEPSSTGEGLDEIEGGVKVPVVSSEDTDRDTVAEEDTDFEPMSELEEGEEGAGEATTEKLDTKGEAPKKKKPKPKIKVEGEEEGKGAEEGAEEAESEEEEGEESIKEKKVAAPPLEIVEAHPPNTVSYLSWKIYSYWLDEFGKNIQTYGTCLHKFRSILEGGTNMQAGKIRTILTNWSTYLSESMKFEKDMANYFKGKKMTKCAKCGDFSLYNIPKDHEIPNELKQAATSTDRWKKLLVEAEELCRSFSASGAAEDTVSMVSHESIDITEGYFDTSQTSMYVVEDFFPNRR